jgi:hypothetical protein
MEVESMDFSKMTLAVQIAAMLEYDDRTPPNWHGYVGHSNVGEGALLISRSYASPREGANQERLLIGLADGRVRLAGFDEAGRSFDIRSALTPDAVLERVHNAAVNGVRVIADFLRAVRTGNTSGPDAGRETVEEL